MTQQEAVILDSAENAPGEVKSNAAGNNDVEKAAKVEQAVNAITEELNKAPTEGSGAAPVTNAEAVIPPAEKSESTTNVEKAAAKTSDHDDEDDKDFIDFTPKEEKEAEAVKESSTASVESGKLDAAATPATNDQINNSAESSDTLELKAESAETGGSETLEAKASAVESSAKDLLNEVKGTQDLASLLPEYPEIGHKVDYNSEMIKLESGCNSIKGDIL